jgi:putative DNA primase/helicase
MHYGENVLTELKAQARADPTVEVEADEFGLSPGRVAVENGLLDLHAAADDAGDAAIRDLRPEDYALSQLPVRYDPDATGDRWRQFVGEVVEPAKIHAVQEYVGYTLHRGAMPHAKAMLLVGSGKNGKTTFLNVIRELLGEEQTTSKPVHKFDDENHVADLYGSVANIDADLSQGSLSSRGIATFKRLVGGDTVDAAIKYQDPFSFKPTAKHLYACNQVPDVSQYVSDHDIAFWRRWVVVEFPNYFTEEERDPNLERKLTDPDTLPAVLNWAIDGWARLRDNGQFTDAEGHDETRRRWQSWGESVEKFITGHVERDPDAPRLSTGGAYERYQAWCRENDADPVGRRRFTDTLKNEDVGYGRHRINGRSARGYDALGLSDDVPDPDGSDEVDDDDSDDDDGTIQQGLS